MERYITQKGNITFMAIKTPLKNKTEPSKKPQYTISVELDIKDPALQLLKKLNPKKVNTKNNLEAQLAGTRSRDKFAVSFSSEFAPKTVVDDKGTDIEAPYFDSRVDTGEAEVEFSVNQVGDKAFINLQGVRLSNLVITPKEQTKQTSLLKSQQSIEKEILDVLGK